MKSLRFLVPVLLLAGSKLQREGRTNGSEIL
jgi:hypothetical protein